MAASVLSALRGAVVEPGLLGGLAVEAVNHGGQQVDQGVLGAGVAMGQECGIYSSGHSEKYSPGISASLRGA